ncbi:VOC family protein [Microlunatus elymi]|uniref:VOC family protein n=1 Tax=Microlunatus elymi TaxID=2596828 RepID=UPI001AEF6E7A|nr:VOC family protein [Microlunatus elymi]
MAREIAEALERSDISMVQSVLSVRARDWDWVPEEWIADVWRPRLDDLAGADRTLVGQRHVNNVLGRVVFEGSRGQAFVTVLFDEAGKIDGFAIKPDELDGTFGIVVGCDDEDAERLRAFYDLLARAPLGFGEGLGRRPSWQDPEAPQQIHLDFVVTDLEDTEAVVLGHGAVALEDFDDHRVFTDPVGHPFCLYPDTDGRAVGPDRLGVLARVVMDCDDPELLARFWSAVLDMPNRAEDTAHRIVITGETPSLPMLAAQSVEDYRPPQWPDPLHPAQMHLDIGFDDRTMKERVALSHGASRLPAQGGSCPVYADPAGHPFCLCYTGE